MRVVSELSLDMEDQAGQTLEKLLLALVALSLEHLKQVVSNLIKTLHVDVVWTVLDSFGQAADTARLDKLVVLLLQKTQDESQYLVLKQIKLLVLLNFLKDMEDDIANRF